MLKTALLFAGVATALALLAPQLLLDLHSASLAPPPAASIAEAAPVEPPRPTPSDAHGEKSIAADAHGQYSLDVYIGGEPVHMLVDTGATMVVISADVADRLGLSFEAGRKWRVQTANGDSIAAETVLPTLDLGTIYMTNVPALIAPRSAGKVNLLGASFLKRLASVESRNGMLILRQ